MELRKFKMTPFWQNALNDRMEEHYPDIIGSQHLVDAWKRDGWNDGTATLYGVYQQGDQYTICIFADYSEPEKKKVTPKIEHTGWV
jgi:hypothetical protein